MNLASALSGSSLHMTSDDMESNSFRGLEMVNERTLRSGGMSAAMPSPLGPRLMLCAAMYWCRRRMACLAFLMAIVATAMTVPVCAQESGVDLVNRRPSFTAGELALLPPYCNAMQGRADYTGPGGAQWRGWLGNDLQHIHHYCRGLRDAMFATLDARITPQQRMFIWERALNEYGYMIRASNPAMPLMPEIYFKRGEALLKLGRLVEAEQAFTQSWKLKADYPEPYAAWADKLVEMKQFARAREILETGLQHAPQASQLQDRLLKIPQGTGK